MPDLVWFVIRRLFGALLVMLALSLAVYLVFYAIPADPAHLACGKPCTPDRLEQARHFMQLDQSVIQQYLSFLKGIFAGRTFGDGAAAVHCNAPCFGYSFPLARPVTTLIFDRLPITASIAIGAAILWLLFGVSLGLGAGMTATLDAYYRGLWMLLQFTMQMTLILVLSLILGATPLFKGLPDDRCQSPHWGYVKRGQVTFRFADRDEVYVAGDAYYAPPGHIPVIEADTEVVEFSPTGEYAKTMEVVARNLAAS